MSNKIINTSGGSNPQIKLTDRQLQLRNYHAKKMAEKRKETAIVQQIQSKNATSSSAGGSAVGGSVNGKGNGRGGRGYIPNPSESGMGTGGMQYAKDSESQKNYGRQPPKESAQQISTSATRSNAINSGRLRYRDSDYVQRSLLQQEEQQQQQQQQQQQHFKTEKMQKQIALMSIVPSSKSNYRSIKYGNDETGKSSISQILTPSPLPSVLALSPAPSATSAVSNLSKSSPMQTMQLLEQTKGMTTHQKAAFMASLRHGGPNNSGTKTSGNGELVIDLRPKIDGNGNWDKTTLRENTPIVGNRHTSVINASTGNGKSSSSNSASISGLGTSFSLKANSTIGTASLDNREKMKRMFAARRRKAQLEMSLPGGNADGGSDENGGSIVGNETEKCEMESIGSSDSKNALNSVRAQTTNDAIPAIPTKAKSAISSSSTDQTNGSVTSMRFSRGEYEKYFSEIDVESSEVEMSAGPLNNEAKFGKDHGVGKKTIPHENDKFRSVEGNAVSTELPNSGFNMKVHSKQQLLGTTFEKDINEEVVPKKKLPESILRESSSHDSNESKTVRFQLPTPQMDHGLKNPQCSPPRACKFTDAESTPQKKFPLKVKTDVIPIPDAALIGDNEDIDYVLFVADLKREIATGHSELWFGFQQLLGRSKGEYVPLYRSLIDDKDTSSKDAKKSKKKKKKVKMDPKSTHSLKSIHEHLMKNDRIKGKFMTSNSQLVNDKETLEDRNQNHPVSEESLNGVESIPKLPIRHPPFVSSIHHGEERKGSTQKTFQSSKYALSKPATLQLTDQGDDNMNEAPGESSQDEDCKDSKRSWINSYKKKKSIYMSAYRSSSSGNSQNGKPITPTSESSTRESDIKHDKEIVNSSKTKKLSWLDALKKKQKSLRQAQKVDTDKEIQDTVYEKIEEDFSKQLSPRKKVKLTQTKAAEKDTSVHPWGHVQLKSAPKRESFFGPQREGPDRPSSETPEISEATEQSQTKSDTLDTTPEDDLLCIGDVIDLENLPQRAFPSEEGSAMFKLKSSAQRRVGEATENVIIVGKNVVVTASCTLCHSNNKSRILRWCRRSDVRALTLNVETTGAELSLSNGRPPIPLLFDSTDVCLEFMHVWYRGPSNKTESREYQPERVQNSKESFLSKDEESLLDKYRQFSHSDRSKIKLTCLSLKDELNDAEVASLSSSTFSSSSDDVAKEPVRGVDGDNNLPSLGSKGDTGLTKEEEATALKYRRMLNMGVPADAVMHKMTMEGADAKIISAVRNAVEIELNEKKGGELTEAEEETASKYRRMLKMRVPPDAVRHKMKCEGVDEKVIRAVLDKQESTEAQNKLTDEEELIASKYRRMLKMRVPPDAVRHKMNSEGVDEKIISAVLEELKPMEDPKTLSEEEEEIASKYRRMLKMRVPPDAVRHKMTSENVDEKIIDAVLPSTTKNEDDAGLSHEEEVIAAKYRRMLKMSVPLEAVKHKMAQDQVEMRIISAVTNEAAPAEDKKAWNTSTIKPALDAPTLSEEEEKTATTYRNMLKVCIPKDAVRHKMKQDGISVKIVEAVLGKENSPALPSTNETAKNTNSKTMKLHWTVSTLAPELLKQSIFAKAEQKKRKLSTINPEESDIKKLEELFQKKTTTKSAASKAGTAENDKIGSEMAKLLDITRANNIAISLNAFSNFSFRSLAETINDLDPNDKIDSEKVQFIPNLLPTAKEMMAIKKFTGEEDKLITAELFFRQLIPIKRIEDKVKVMQTMASFEEHVEEARSGFQCLQEVCGQVMNSEKLISILEMVLNIGNFMNQGTLDGGVEAFKFESLPKLSQTKSADGKTTVLDYIVETFIEKGERETLFIASDFPRIQESSRILIGDLMSEMAMNRSNLKLCHTELARMKHDQSSKKVTNGVMEKKIEGESTDPRKALFAAIKARGAKENSEEEKQPDDADPRQALFAAIKNRNKSATLKASESDNPEVSKLSLGVQKLQRFLTHAEVVLSFGERDQDAAIRACKGLAVYCGEEGGERSAGPLLQIICEFATSLESAIKKYDEKKEAERRKLERLKKSEAGTRKQNEKEKEEYKEKENQSRTLPKKSLRLSSMQPHVGVTDRFRKTATETTTKTAATTKVEKVEKSEKESRVFLVNRMLSEAPDEVKKDFLSGVTYKETDDPILKKIYEKEEVLNVRGFPRK